MNKKTTDEIVYVCGRFRKQRHALTIQNSLDLYESQTTPQKESAASLASLLTEKTKCDNSIVYHNQNVSWTIPHRSPSSPRNRSGTHHHYHHHCNPESKVANKWKANNRRLTEECCTNKPIVLHPSKNKQCQRDCNVQPPITTTLTTPTSHNNHDILSNSDSIIGRNITVRIERHHNKNNKTSASTTTSSNNVNNKEQSTRKTTDEITDTRTVQFTFQANKFMNGYVQKKLLLKNGSTINTRFDSNSSSCIDHQELSKKELPSLCVSGTEKNSVCCNRQNNDNNDTRYRVNVQRVRHSRQTHSISTTTADTLIRPGNTVGVCAGGDCGNVRKRHKRMKPTRKRFTKSTRTVEEDLDDIEVNSSLFSFLVVYLNADWLICRMCHNAG